MNAVRFSIAIPRLAVCAAIAPILLSTGAGSALAANSGPEKSSYDPSTCKTDAHGKVYIALGHNVFAMPVTGSVIVARYGNDWLVPPDPTEPVGCQNDPEQLTGYGFPYAFNVAVGNQNAQFPNAAPRMELLQLIHVPARVGAGSESDGTEWHGEKFELGIAHAVCDKADVLEELASGLTACREGAKDKELSVLPVQDWLTSYIARTDAYQTPLARPFVVNCSARAYTSAVGQCDVAYVLRAGLGVAYRFRPYWGPSAIPIDLIVQFDQGLRAAISNALVKDYTWPEQPPHPKSN